MVFFLFFCIAALQKKSKYSYSHCYVLPAQFNKFLQDFKQKSTQLFTLKSLGPEATPLDKWGSFHSFHSKMYCCLFFITL